MAIVDRTLYPLPENWKEIFVRTFQLAEERGSCSTMRGLIEDADEEIMSCSDNELIASWLDFKNRAQSAFAYEDTNGKLSFLNRDHPMNIRLIKAGLLGSPANAVGLY